jgi:hypothetical protein
MAVAFPASGSRTSLNLLHYLAMTRTHEKHIAVTSLDPATPRS